jgi:hypothetical protein
VKLALVAAAAVAALAPAAQAPARTDCLRPDEGVHDGMKKGTFTGTVLGKNVVGNGSFTC